MSEQRMPEPPYHPPQHQYNAQPYGLHHNHPPRHRQMTVHGCFCCLPSEDGSGCGCCRCLTIRGNCQMI